MSRLFSPLTLREVTFRNRAWVSPMCQYSAVEGLPNEWHLVHLGSRAVGRAGLVMTEATAVTRTGRISPGDTGLWSKTQAEAFARIAAFVREQGAIAGIQLAHAGRKGSTEVPWRGGAPLTGSQAWQTVAPSPLPFSDKSPVPRALDASGLREVCEAFAEAASLAEAAGFQVIELHMAHGYLLHEFLSPLSNRREDDYGGSPAGRARFPLEVARAVRASWPLPKPLFVRLSCSDWAPGGLDIADTVQISRWLVDAGADLIDCSSGGIISTAQIPTEPGYQVPFAQAIKAAGVPSAAVGLITDPVQAETILASGAADAIFIAREELRDPYWPLHAANVLGADVGWPPQYARAKG